MIDLVTSVSARPPTVKKNNSQSSARKSVYLWEFLFGLLEDDECSSVISWTDKREGIFALHNTDELAKLWGTVKNKPNMNKYKLFRAMRNYYGKGMLKKVTLAFAYIAYSQFCLVIYWTKIPDNSLVGSTRDGVENYLCFQFSSLLGSSADQ